MPRFRGLASFLKAKLNVDAAYEYGNPGDFEVYCNQKLVYSKAATGSYPSPPQVLEEIQKLEK